MQRGTGADDGDSMALLALADLYNLAVHVFVPHAPELKATAQSICRPLLLDGSSKRNKYKVHLKLVSGHFTGLTGTESAVTFRFQHAKAVTALLDRSVDIALDKYVPLWLYASDRV